MTRFVVWLVIAVAAPGCDHIVELIPDGDDAPDAAPPCTPGDTECSNCLDDDDDGDIDGFDVECTGAVDDDEGSFDTAIPGDNGGVAQVDCFFDGNSGSGDDGCDIHVCCVLDECPDGLPGPTFDPDDPSLCLVTAECIGVCEPLLPPGCDCFGCCTICDGPECVDIYLSPALAEDCDADTIGDPVACPRCHQVESCVEPCGGASCILCPGQTPDDLPPSCTGAECPDGASTCATSDDCGSDEFCASGCCIGVVE